MNSTWWLRRPFLVGLVGLLASAAGAGWVVLSGARPAAAAREEAVQAEARDRGAGRFIVSFGHVDVEPGVTALSPSQPGRVADVQARENQVVAAGTELLRLEDRLARLRVREAEAEVTVAQKRLAEARKLPEQHQRKIRQQQAALEAVRHRRAAARYLRDRREELSQIHQAHPAEARAAEESVKELEAAEQGERAKLAELEASDPAVGLAGAEAGLRVREARLEQARYVLEQCTLKAPRDGTVLRILVGPGDQVGLQARQPALFFLPAGPRVVRAEVEQEYASRVAVGQRALIEDDSRAGGTWEGKVARVSDWYTHRRSILLDPLQFNDVRTLECIIEIASGSTLPRIGQRVRVTLGQGPPQRGASTPATRDGSGD
jgi:multidrug resistance efflux pump